MRKSTSSPTSSIQHQPYLSDSLGDRPETQGRRGHKPRQWVEANGMTDNHRSSFAVQQAFDSNPTAHQHNQTPPLELTGPHLPPYHSMASSNHTELQTPSDAPFFVQHLQKNLWPYIDASNIEDGLLEAIERLNSQVKHQDLSARTVRPRHQKPPRQQYVPSYTSLSRKPRSRHVEDSSKAVTWKEILIASMTRFKSRSVNGEPDQNILWTAVKRRTMKPRFTQTM